MVVGCFLRRCEALAEAVACVFSSVRCVSGRRLPLRPSESWQPGDLAADIQPVRCIRPFDPSAHSDFTALICGCAAGRQASLCRSQPAAPLSCCCTRQTVQGGYELLLELAATQGPKWELVRMAAVVSLAGALVRATRHSALRRRGGLGTPRPALRGNFIEQRVKIVS